MNLICSSCCYDVVVYVMWSVERWRADRRTSTGKIKSNTLLFLCFSSSSVYVRTTYIVHTYSKFMWFRFAFKFKEWEEDNRQSIYYSISVRKEGGIMNLLLSTCCRSPPPPALLLFFHPLRPLHHYTSSTSCRIAGYNCNCNHMRNNCLMNYLRRTGKGNWAFGSYSYRLNAGREEERLRNSFISAESDVCVAEAYAGLIHTFEIKYFLLIIQVVLFSSVNWSRHFE